MDWMIEQSGAELFVFSTDFPHPEGGRDPLQKFDDALAGARAEGGSRGARSECGGRVSCVAGPKPRSARCRRAMMTAPVALQEFDAWLTDGLSSGRRAWLGAVSRVACGAR